MKGHSYYWFLLRWALVVFPQIWCNIFFKCGTNFVFEAGVFFEIWLGFFSEMKDMYVGILISFGWLSENIVL